MNKKQTCYLLGLIGYPLSHTLSPPMHMAALAKQKINGLYVPFEIDPKRFSETAGGLRYLPFQGVNVTVPYKEKIVPYLDRMSDEATIIGAVNTITIGKQLVGHNTDAYGFSRSLKEDLSFSVRGKRILLIGAGGAARACIYTLAKEKASTIIIADVVEARAKRLKDHFSEHFPKVRFIITQANREHYALFIKEVDLVINATPIGLKRKDPLLVSPQAFKKKIAVYDLVYNPATTKLLQAAKSKGCRTANGLGMLLYQGVKAYEMWTERKAPVSVMRAALKKAVYKR